MSKQKKNILAAALNEFSGNGLAGARLQNIADEVGVTKAMIHYYYDSKENLFREVFSEAYETVGCGLFKILESDDPLFSKIEDFVSEAIERFHSEPALVDFITNALNKYPEITVPIMKELIDHDVAIFENQLNEAASRYEIAVVDSRQVVLNMLSLCMFPYGARVFMSEVLKVENDKAYRNLLEQRKGIVTDTIINWLAS
ncbi:MAG: TetR/AcrR family transcriptional regulator [Candidatus Halalkalibacterium sp. M3_1C_030]